MQDRTELGKSMTTGAERTVAALEARLHAYETTRDAQLLLDERAKRQADELALGVANHESGINPQESASAVRIATVARFYLLRSAIMSGDEGRLELEQAVILFSLVQLTSPDLVPESVRRLVEEDIERQRVVMALEARLRAYESTQDAQLLLDEQAERQATELIRGLQFGAHGIDPGKVPSAATVARFYLLRSAVSPLDRGRLELEQAVILFSLVQLTSPDLVPESIRPLVDEMESEDWRDEMLRPSAVVLHEDGVAALLQAEHTGSRAALEQAIELLQRAADGFAVTHPGRGLVFADLVDALRIRSERTGNLQDLDEAIQVCSDAVASIAPDTPEGFRQRLRGQLADLQRLRSEHAGDHSSSAAGLAPPAATPDDDADRVTLLAQRATWLLQRFGFAADPADLDEAVELLWQAASAAPPENRAGILAQLAGALWTRFTHSADPRDLDEAIQARIDTVAATDPGDPNLAVRLSNLGISLLGRFDHTMDRRDLNGAVAVLRKARAVIPPGDPVPPAILSNLAIALRRQFEDPDERDEFSKIMGGLLVDMVVDPRDQEDRPARPAAWTGAPGELTEAVDLLRQVVQTVSADDPNHPTALSNLAVALRTRFHREGQQGDLDEALRYGREALTATPAGHPDRPARLMNHALTLKDQFDRDQDQTVLDEATQTLQQVMDSTTAQAGIRARAGWVLGHLEASVDDSGQAVEGFAAAVRLLPAIAWRGLTRGPREQRLARWTGLASDAAAWALHDGDPQRAVELLEQGRGVLLAQAFQARGGLEELRERAPELAARLMAVGDALEHDPDGLAWPPDLGGRPPSAWPVVQPVAGQHELAREWEELAGWIHALPGFSDLLQAPSFSQLAQAGADGPVVIVNVSPYRCDGLAVSPDGVAVIPLPDLNPVAVNVHTGMFLTALQEAADTGQSMTSQLAAQRRVRETLYWLWETIAGPILQALDLNRPTRPDQPLPRLWWCPTGLLGFLPLHAATPKPATAGGSAPDGVLDRAICSYTPTLRSLLHARAAPAAAAQPSLLIVAMPDTPDLTGLPQARKEAELLARLNLRHELLEGATASRQPVMAGLERHPWAHLACHATQDLVSPSNGRLFLFDQSLSVRDIAQLRLEHAELAFLSACDTARGGFDLPDEAIHIASAMQLAGYRHVIATLWPVTDERAVDVSSHFYAGLGLGQPGRFRRSGIRLTESAVALHGAVRQLRDRYPNTPTLWASYIHAGP